MTAVVGDELDEAVRSAISLMVSLSETSSTPSEFDKRNSIDAATVGFRDASWIAGIVEIQDWLRLDEPLDLDDGANYVVRRLLQGIAPSTSLDRLVSEMDDAVLTLHGLEVLTSHLERAAALRDRFLDDLEVLGRSAATADWVTAWDEIAEASLSGPIRARATTWAIRDFAIRAENGQLDLSPTYQRGDVWPSKDAQLLIESVLRGIPLPSIIVLDPRTSSAVNYEVVDGKQRLSTILRFIGRHPIALQQLSDLTQVHPAHPWLETFSTDYPAFRQLWRRVMGRALTLTQEKELYFPFKLAPDLGLSQGASSPLADFAGRYYTEIADETVDVAGSIGPIRDLFEGPSDYQIPVIEYTEASPRQIHEVFNIYNRQGKHLNAEEIRNAVYHDIPLMRVLATAAGDRTAPLRASRFNEKPTDSLSSIEQIFDGYGVSRSRFKRTKILSWIMATSLISCTGPDGAPRRLATAQQINHLMELASDPGHPLGGRGKASEAVGLIAFALQTHHGMQNWAPSFRGARGWQDLTLVASVVPLVLAAPVLGPELPDRMRLHEDRLAELSATSWAKPRKTQTNVQWEFQARVALEMLSVLDVPNEAAHVGAASLFGDTSIPGLRAIASSD